MVQVPSFAPVEPEPAILSPIVWFLIAEAILFLQVLSVVPDRFLPPNEPNLRLNLHLAAVLALGLLAEALLRLRGPTPVLARAALGIAGYALFVRAYAELLVSYRGEDLDRALSYGIEHPSDAVTLCRVGGLIAFAAALGLAAGSLARARRSGTPGRTVRAR